LAWICFLAHFFGFSAIQSGAALNWFNTHDSAYHCDFAAWPKRFVDGNVFWVNLCKFEWPPIDLIWWWTRESTPKCGYVRFVVYRHFRLPPVLDP
jgi:hypothetical protein